MGQFILHRSEWRRVAAICAAALNEREAQARRKAPKPSSSQRGCRDFTHAQLEQLKRLPTELVIVFVELFGTRAALGTEM